MSCNLIPINKKSNKLQIKDQVQLENCICISHVSMLIDHHLCKLHIDHI